MGYYHAIMWVKNTSMGAGEYNQSIMYNQPLLNIIYILDDDVTAYGDSLAMTLNDYFISHIIGKTL